MRVLVIAYLHPDVASGGEQQMALEMFDACLEAGHEAYLLCALEDVHTEDLGKPGAPIVPVPGRARQYFFFPQFYDHFYLSVRQWRALSFLKDFIEKLAPDVVHFHHYHRLGVEAIRVARLAAPRAAVTVTFHEMMAICHADGQMVRRDSGRLCASADALACGQCFPGVRPEVFDGRKQRLQAFLDEADAFIFPSEFLADRFLSWGLDARKAVVIHNGIRDLPNLPDPRGHSNRLNKFGIFGQFLDNKGLDVVLEAALLIARDAPATSIDIEINLANKQYASNAYVERITALLLRLQEMPSGVRIVERGAYDRDELARRMADVDWVLVPSTWWEVFGLVVSEAWMCGRPVIASDIGGLGERVRAGANGLLFRPRDSRELAEIMRRVTGDADLWSALNRGIGPSWTPRQMLEGHLQVWDEILAQVRAPA